MSALTIVAIIAIIILTVGLNGLYHKIFDVYYLGAGGFFKEWGICLAIAFVIVGLIFSALGLEL